jgi:uncharacterized membrane protein SpoIIM required for sporulation
MIVIVAGMVPTPKPITETQQRQWQELARILDRVQKGGLRQLSPEELIDLGRLYRRAAADLARARASGLDARQIEHLNALVGRAYAYVYTTETRGRSSIVTFFAREFPQSVRRCAPFIGAALAVFLVAAAIGLIATYRDADAPNALLGPGWSASLEGITRRHTGKKDWLPGEMRPIASSGIMTNNIMVSILAFSLGVLGCLGTLFIMFFNGLMLGAIAAAVDQRNVALGFWAFAAPHGVIELPAIFIAGGAGLLLGYAVINPGDVPRGVALRQAGGEAIQLVMGVAAMLVVAGLIEGFFSPSLLPEGLKYGLAVVLAVSLVAYLTLAGREPEEVSGRVGDGATGREDSSGGRDAASGQPVAASPFRALPPV